MASPNSNSHHLHAFANVALYDMKDKMILGQNSGTNASQPTEKDQNVKLKNKQLVPQEEGGQPKPQRISITLTKEQIENDLFAMTGRRPLRYKKKRTKKMKEDLEVLFPGGSLDGHTPETLLKSYGPFSSKRY